jgi:hypothetical protein
VRHGKSENKTVSILFPLGPQAELKVNLWHSWPSNINFNPRAEGMATVVIEFQTEQIEVQFPKAK